MIEFDTSIRISRIPAQVSSVLANFESCLAGWAKGCVAAARTNGGGELAGTTRSRSGSAGCSVLYEVTGGAAVAWLPLSVAHSVFGVSWHAAVDR